MIVFTINNGCEYFVVGATSGLECTMSLLSEILHTSESGDFITITVGEMTQEQLEKHNASIGTI